MKQHLAGLIAGVFILFGAQAHAAQNDVVQATLANGMHIVIIPNHLAPVVTTSLVYNVGGNDDVIPGLAHATEHMMFRGTQTVTSDQFANIATRTGAQYNAQTTNQYTQYYFTVPATYLDVVLHLEADRMSNAKMAQADWANERGAIEQEIKAQLGNPLLPISTKINQLYFGNSPWGQMPGGTIAGFEKMNASDIAAFYHRWYHPNNATLAVAGDVDPQAVLASVHKLFDDIPSAQLPSHPPLVMLTPPSTSLSETVDFPVPIAIVTFRMPGMEAPDAPASAVLIDTLNSKRSALGELALSGKALVSLAYDGAYPTDGMGFLMSGLRPGSDIKASLDDLEAVIAQYAKDGVPADLVDVAKNRILASQAYEGASIPGQAEEWSTAVAIRHQTPAQLYAAYEHVTPADVTAALRAYMAGGTQVKVSLSPKPNASMPTANGLLAKENVTVTAKDAVALPAWTKGYFSAPLQAPRADDHVTVFRLRNGMTVAVRPETTSPTVAISGSIRMNTDLNEPKGKDGVAAIAQALLPLGTQFHDAKAYQAELDAIAANVYVGPSFRATVRSENFDTAIGILAEGMLHPAFAPDQFSIVLKNDVTSVKAVEDRPETKAALARVDALFPPGDPHRRHATSATLQAVNLDDVKRWYAFAYRPDLTTVAVVGDVRPADVKAAFEKYFGGWKATGRRPNFDYPEVRSNGQRTSTTIASPTAQQATVTLSQHLDLRRGDRDVVALYLANTMLSGEGTGSMLFHDVRKAKGYVYTIDSNLDVSDTGSTFQVEYASDPNKVDPAQHSAAQTIQRLRRYAPNDADLALAKAQLLADYVVELDTYNGVASQLLHDTEEGVDSNGTARFYARVLATTPQDVQRAMQRWIDPSKFKRIVVAPEGK